MKQTMSEINNVTQTNLVKVYVAHFSGMSQFLNI